MGGWQFLAVKHTQSNCKLHLCLWVRAGATLYRAGFLWQGCQAAMCRSCLTAISSWLWYGCEQPRTSACQSQSEDPWQKMWHPCSKRFKKEQHPEQGRRWGTVFVENPCQSSKCMDWQRETTAFQPQPPEVPTTSLKGLGEVECNAWQKHVMLGLRKVGVVLDWNWLGRKREKKVCT